MTNSTIDIEQIKLHLNDQNIQILYFKSIDSTNSYLKQNYTDFSPDIPTVVISETQTAGYGRFHRAFYSPANTGIYLSVLLPQSIKPIATMTLQTGTSIVSTLRDFFDDEQFSLKWVNDILLDQQKCGGILAESINGRVIVGFGLNINTAKFPSELKGIAQNMTDKNKIDRNLLISDLLKNFFKFINSADLTEYRQYCTTIGQKVEIINGNRSIIGMAEDVANDGSLVIIDDKKNRHSINSGEVTKVFSNLD